MPISSVKPQSLNLELLEETVRLEFECRSPEEADDLFGFIQAGIECGELNISLGKPPKVVRETVQ